jgi:hypothetical protein
MLRFKSFSNYIRKVRKSMAIKVYLSEDEKEIRNMKIFETRPITICKNENPIKKENPIQIQAGKSSHKVVVTNKPKVEPIKVIMNDAKKGQIIVKKNQEKTEVITTLKTVEDRKDLNAIIEEEKKNICGSDGKMEKKCEEFRGIMGQEVINLNVVIETPKEEKKKEPYRFLFDETKQRNIEMMAIKKVVDNEEIPEPKIIKENGEYKVVKEIPDSEKAMELLKNDPVIKRPEDLRCEERKLQRKK